MGYAAHRSDNGAALKWGAVATAIALLYCGVPPEIAARLAVCVTLVWAAVDLYDRFE
jgi:hypothetical protein